MFVNTYKQNQKQWNNVFRHVQPTDQRLFQLYFKKLTNIQEAS